MTPLELIARLMTLDPPVYLFGGFAEDAVLYGRISRPHGDVDVLIWLDELTMRMEQTRALGFTRFEVRFEAVPGHPLALGSVSAGLDLELCVGERDSSGRGFFYRPSATGPQRCWLPSDTFSYPPQKLDGVTVRTVSPLAMYQVRAALAEVFGGMREKDRLAQAALRDRCLATLAEVDLAPHIEPGFSGA